MCEYLEGQTVQCVANYLCIVAWQRGTFCFFRLIHSVEDFQRQVGKKRGYKAALEYLTGEDEL